MQNREEEILKFTNKSFLQQVIMSLAKSQLDSPRSQIRTKTKFNFTFPLRKNEKLFHIM